MAIEHKMIVDAQLHEPKGAAGAANHAVYVANGSGSGAFEKIDAANVDSGVATIGQVLAADGSGGTSWVTEPGGTHGEMEIVGNTIPTPISTAATYVKIAENTPAGDTLSGITFDTDHLIVPSDGVYFISVSCSFEGSAGDVFKFDVGIGAGLAPLGHVGRRKTPNADVGHISILGMHTLSANDSLYTIVQNEAATSDPTITDLVMVVYKLSE